MSGNQLANGHWRYLRQIQVNPVDTNPQARQVIVKIWKCASDTAPLVPGLLLNTTIGTVVPGTLPTYSQTPQRSFGRSLAEISRIKISFPAFALK